VLDLLYNFQDFTDLLLVVPKGDTKNFNWVIPFIRINRIWGTVSPVKYEMPVKPQAIFLTLYSFLLNRVSTAFHLMQMLC